ncbi:MAG: DUF3570 domain-containing protein [Candidatus Manganitrophus sp.]|nr:DUF3570 domain-containing protein [Candidatus Manganitrophus sp.]WDT70829.1 MAG: DUF3570 domain-containing protein [Candidatus Manganitrophus sp.]WDT81906.1 MAG: DUF3570 domain-containing protein [Candidatus Manganitrophus sp.]
MIDRYKAGPGGLIAALFVFLVGSFWAQPAAALDIIDLSMGYYKDDNRLTVNTPGLLINKDLTESASFSIKYTYETFEKEAPQNAADAVTGATTVSGGTGGGYDETRHEIVAGFAQQFRSTLIGLGYFYGDENDFHSDAYSVALTQFLFETNLAVTALYGKTFDEIDKLDPPNDDFPKDKDTDTFTIAATQILTPRLLISGGYSLSKVEGFQSLPLRKVNAIQGSIQGIPIGTIYEEKHPDERTRQTFFLGLKQYFLSGRAIYLNLSYYMDDWGVHAIAAEPRIQQYLSESVILRLRYRFYSQTAADFYQPTYSASEVTEESLKTADVRLRDYDTHTVGIAIRLVGKMIDDWSVLMSYDRYFETNDGLKANIYQVTLSIPY